MPPDRHNRAPAAATRVRDTECEDRAGGREDGAAGAGSLPGMSTARCAPAIDDDARARYRDEGFLRLGRVLDDDLLAAVRADEARMRSADTRQEAASTRFWNLVCRWCPGVRRAAMAGGHLDAVEAIVGPDIALWWNQFVTKLPDPDETTGTFPWHQDNGYKDIAPGDNVTVWIALDDVDERNGCVWVQPGSHRGGLRPHSKRSQDSWHLTVPVEGDGVPVPMAAGEGVLFSAYTLHRSLANRSQRPRRALFLEYTRADAVIVDLDRMPVCDHKDTWVVRGAAPYAPRT